VNQATTDGTLHELRLLLEEEIRAGRLTLPVMPDVALRAREAAASATSSAKDLAEILEADPALAARILKMANSAMYAGLSEIRDLSHAIVRLGAAMVVAVVVGAAGKEVFRTKDPAFRELLRESWEASVHAAAVARLLADRASMPREEGMLAGLLHASGDPILVQLIEDLVAQGRIERPSVDTVREVLGLLAPRAAVRLLSKWGLPEVIVRAIEYQQAPGAAPEPFQKAAALVTLSALAGRGSVAGEPVEELARQVGGHPAAGLLLLDEEVARELLDRAREEGREIARTFS